LVSVLCGSFSIIEVASWVMNGLEKF